MIDNFERLTGGVTGIYKDIQKLKKLYVGDIGLKGIHVMCIYYLHTNPDGLTAAGLCEKCREDKAGISRILSELEASGIITYPEKERESGRKYRSRAVLTEKGRSCAVRVTELIRQATRIGGSGVSEQEREIFYHVLFAIAGNLDDLLGRLETAG